MGSIHFFFHKFIETRENKGKLKYSRKTSCYNCFRKKDRDKTYVKKWRPILLVNLDTKMLSKASSVKCKPILPSVASSDQIAYVKKRDSSESSRLIFDITETCGKFIWCI